MPTSDELNHLARAVAAGDRQAFALLFKHFAPRVKAYLMRGGTPATLADELTQETMVAVWRKCESFDPARAGLSTWIFTIARNLRIDRHRRHAEPGADAGEADTGPDEMPDTAPPLDEQLGASRRDDRLRLALTRLSNEQSMLLRLSFYEDQPHARIASDLGLPLGTVKSRIRLAVAHLRRLLGESEP